MEKRDKIIIGGLAVVVLALAAGLAMMMTGNGDVLKGDVEVAEGMQVYDFDSQFTMQVPNDAKFIKEWNASSYFVNEVGMGYLDKANKFAVLYVDAPGLNEEVLQYFLSLGEKSENVTFEELDDNRVVAHILANDGKVGDSLENCNFTEGLIFHKGHTWIILQGNDANQVKDMANTIKLYGE